MPPITAELQQNIVVTLYLLFTHNYIAIMYFAGLVLAIALSFYRPSRFTTLITVGFAVLLFSYEYDKHIVDGLREQTTRSLITMTPHYTLKRYIDLFLADLLPMLMYGFGWLCLFVAIFYAAVKVDIQTSRTSFRKEFISLFRAVVRKFFRGKDR